MRLLLLLLIAVTWLIATPARAESARPLLRTVIGLYDGKAETAYRRSRVHRLAEMPLNHLGLVVVPHDIRQGLPTEETMRAALGILSWFTDTAAGDADEYAAWLDRQTRAGKKLVFLGHPGADPFAMSRAGRQSFDAALARIGLRWGDEWVDLTYSSRIARKDAAMNDFEHALPPLLPPYQRVAAIGPEAKVYLSAQRDGDAAESVLAAAGPAGGYVAAGYAADEMPGADGAWAWQIDPFRFFAAAFETHDLPKPDTTTMSGRRLYYSQIDGDGWHNESSVQSDASPTPSAALILFQRVLSAYPDLPVTVAPISADLDLEWYGDEDSRALARRMFALPWVEAGTHTHSHPFAWAFFRNPDPRKEIRYLPLYPQRPGRSLQDSVWDPELVFPDGMPRAPVPDNALPPGYDRPRSYALKPFDLAEEVEGSVRRIEELLPKGKRVMLFQWSGDTSPYPAAVARVKASGLRNINGGDSRMDGLYRSYAQVAPLGIDVGGSLQVYSSSSNENIYTDNWHARFYAFRSLIDTLEATERPIRVKPIDVYYHFYSAERQDSLNALRAVLDYARTQEIAPVAASRFAAMVEGFAAARIAALGDRRWRIENRDGIETLRFDGASTLAVDFARSEGVIGQRHANGSLYVALDRAVAAPVVALRAHGAPEREPDAPRPFLISARWRVERFLSTEIGWRFHAEGFGPGEFAWKVPEPGRYAVTATTAAGDTKRVEASADERGLLTFTVALAAESGADVAVERIAR